MANVLMIASVYDLVMCLSSALDLVSSLVVNHQKRVGYTAYRLCCELGLGETEKRDAALCGAIHDCGAFSLSERLAALEYDFSYKYEWHSKHAEIGAALIKQYAPFSEYAENIRFHHISWNNGRGSEFNGKPVPEMAHILNIADRVDVLINSKTGILHQAPVITQMITDGKDNLFKPELVEAFKSLSTHESYWFDLITDGHEKALENEVKPITQQVGMEGIIELVKLLSRFVDFRSKFTAAHSNSVAAVAEELARISGMHSNTCLKIKVAGYLHDLGKLAVPSEILEKPARLEEHEFNIIKAHPYHTMRSLENLFCLRDIVHWASSHHEHIDGTGYPFHYSEDSLPVESRIIAAADVFTAISEDRPYRQGMKRKQIEKTLGEMVSAKELDGDIVGTLISYYDEIHSARITSHSAEYSNFAGISTN